MLNYFVASNLLETRADKRLVSRQVNFLHGLESVENQLHASISVRLVLQASNQNQYGQISVEVVGNGVQVIRVQIDVRQIEALQIGRQFSNGCQRFVVHN